MGFQCCLCALQSIQQAGLPHSPLPWCSDGHIFQRHLTPVPVLFARFFACACAWACVRAFPSACSRAAVPVRVLMYPLGSSDGFHKASESTPLTTSQCSFKVCYIWSCTIHKHPPCRVVHDVLRSILQKVNLEQFASSTKVERLVEMLQNTQSDTPGAKSIVFSQVCVSLLQ